MLTNFRNSKLLAFTTNFLAMAFSLLLLYGATAGATETAKQEAGVVFLLGFLVAILTTRLLHQVKTLINQEPQPINPTDKAPTP